MSAPQSKFTATLPTQDQSTPPNTLVAGQITQLDFVVNGATYSWPVPAATAPGAVVVVTFAETTPPFVPVPGTSYTADAFAVDASGNGALSNSQTWIQLAAATAPAAPTGFSVS
jgi:hypothetical protein